LPIDLAALEGCDQGDHRTGKHQLLLINFDPALKDLFGRAGHINTIIVTPLDKQVAAL
jgi:hypothetical protein